MTAEPRPEVGVTKDAQPGTCERPRGRSEARILQAHEDVLQAAREPQRFSSAVSRFLQVPNGMDGDEHARFRALVESYMTREKVELLTPVYVQIANQLVSELQADEHFDVVWGLGARYAVRAQIAWLGWAPDLEPVLVQWMHDHHEAGIAGDDALQAAVSAEFDSIVMGELKRHRTQLDQFSDPTSELLRDSIDGNVLTDAQMVSILRNWTAGDLGSIAASIGVICLALARAPRLQSKLRQLVTQSASDRSSDDVLDSTIDELLRINDPFPSSRRITTCDVQLASGELISRGTRIELSWRSANRDPLVFEHPDRVDPQANAQSNLVYGAGPHVCPGRALATMELRVITAALLRAGPCIELVPDADSQPGNEAHDALQELWVRLAPR